MTLMKIYTSEATGTDGHLYSIRYMLTAEEKTGLQLAGLIGPCNELIGMQECADRTMADFQKQAYTASGGVMQ